MVICIGICLKKDDIVGYCVYIKKVNIFIKNIFVFLYIEECMGILSGNIFLSILNMV